MTWLLVGFVVLLLVLLPLVFWDAPCPICKGKGFVVYEARVEITDLELRNCQERPETYIHNRLQEYLISIPGATLRRWHNDRESKTIYLQTAHLQCTSCNSGDEMRRRPTEQDLKRAVERALEVLRRPHAAKPRRQRSLCDCGSPIQWRAKGLTGCCSKCKKEHTRKMGRA